MRRFEAFQEVMNVVTDELIVCNIGHPAQELFKIKDRPENFYMLGSMGLASSIGLGIALSTSKKVIALEGDGAVLMNLGSLATIGTVKPKNYVLVIVDNAAYGSTGFQDTYTSSGLQLNQIAKACGIKKTLLIDQEGAIGPELQKALKSPDGPYCLVIKTEKGMPENISVIPKSGLEIKERFIESVKG